MQTNLSGKHVSVTPALKNYVNTKLQRLERHFDHVTNAHVVLSVEKLRQRAEATVHVSGGNLHADAVEGDMYAAIDAMVDKLDRQIKRHKEKLSNHHEKEGGLKAR
jgi:putative sigma-54 modulation protein